MDQQGGTGMTAHMIGYPLFDTTQSGQLSKLPVHLRVARQGCKTADIRIAVKTAQCPAFKKQMQRQTVAVLQIRQDRGGNPSAVTSAV